MRFLDLFKTQREIVKEEIVEVPWHVLGTMDQLEAIIDESKEKPVVIFKHSTRCGISRGVLKLFERNYTYTDEQVKLYFLDLLQNRDISNEIAMRFAVRHESPQMLIIRDGSVMYHNSHHAVEPTKIADFLK